MLQCCLAKDTYTDDVYNYTVMISIKKQALNLPLTSLGEIINWSLFNFRIQICSEIEETSNSLKIILVIQSGHFWRLPIDKWCQVMMTIIIFPCFCSMFNYLKVTTKLRNNLIQVRDDLTSNDFWMWLEGQTEANIRVPLFCHMNNKNTFVYPVETRCLRGAGNDTFIYDATGSSVQGVPLPNTPCIKKMILELNF